MHRFLFFFSFCFQASAFVFYPVGNNPLRWNVANGLAHTNVVNPQTSAIRYYIASDGFSAANREAELAAVRASFDQWQSVPGSTLKFEFAGFISPAGLDVREDNTNVVFWAKQSTIVAGGSMNISGLRGWTSVNFVQDGTIVEADIVLNGREFGWFTDFNNSSNQAQFVESVVVHEIGHFLGLDHASVGGASLAIGGYGVSAETGLSPDEIAAMRFLYPTNAAVSGRIRGSVRLGGIARFGAVVVADDANGNLACATVTRADGNYDLAGLAPGTYGLRVTPLDPGNSGIEKLLRGADIAPEYTDAFSAFSATTNLPVTITAGQVRVQDFAVVSGPAMRITSISKPSQIESLISVHRFAISLAPGSKQFVAVSGATLKSGSVLSITGDGITMGATTFHENAIGGNIHSLSALVTVSSNATPGLRSFVVRHGSDLAYANGYVEIAAPIIDYNFDGLEDRFQRMYWSPWTTALAKPAADPDGDLFSNAFEFRMNTNPTNAASYLLPITKIERTTNSSEITVEADVGKRYQLYVRSAFGSGDWTASGRPSTASTNQLTFTELTSADSKFYRVGLVP